MNRKLRPLLFHPISLPILKARLRARIQELSLLANDSCDSDLKQCRAKVIDTCLDSLKYCKWDFCDFHGHQDNDKICLSPPGRWSCLVGPPHCYGTTTHATYFAECSVIVNDTLILEKIFEQSKSTAGKSRLLMLLPTVVAQAIQHFGFDLCRQTL